MILAVEYKPIDITKLGQVITLLVNNGFLLLVKKYYDLRLKQREQLTRSTLLIASKKGLQLNRLLANLLTAEIDQLRTTFEHTKEDKLLQIIIAAEEIAILTSMSILQNITAPHAN